MRSPILTYIRGSVKVQLRGKRVEELLNMLLLKQMTVWDIKRNGEGDMELYIHVGDYFRLPALLKQTGCRMHIQERDGLPFLLSRVEKRKMFAAGVILFVVGLYLLSSLVWQVQVVGNERIDKTSVLEAASKHGIHPLQWKFRIEDPAVLSRKLMNELPGASWVGVKIEGTRVQIEVVEAAEPEKLPLLSPRHLVSKTDAVITSIVAEQGRPLVQPNTRVRKGDILISGLLGSDENQQAVVAKGKVFGLVWYEYAIEVPLTQKYRVYTGEWHTRRYMVLGGHAVQLTGYGKGKYAHSESIELAKEWRWRGWTLPVGWLEKKVMEVEFVERAISVDDAKEIGLQQAKAELLQLAGPQAEITETKILHDTPESGKVKMRVLFEVNQEIAKELPLVPGHNPTVDQGE